MQLKFNKGDKVIVNTGGKDTIAFIDDPNVLVDLYKRPRLYYREVNGEISFLCRFTEDFSKTRAGGGNYSIQNGDYSAANNTLHINAQYIPEQYIRLIEPYIKTQNLNHE